MTLPKPYAIEDCGGISPLLTTSPIVKAESTVARVVAGRSCGKLGPGPMGQRISVDTKQLRTPCARSVEANSSS